MNMKKSNYEIGELIRFTDIAYPSDPFHEEIVGTFGVFLGSGEYYDEYHIFSFILARHLKSTYSLEIEKIE